VNVKCWRGLAVSTVLVLVLALAACSGGAETVPMARQTMAAASVSAGCPAGADLTKTTQTPSYLLVVNAGDTMPMYSRREAAAQDPARGEIMLGGSMGSMRMMNSKHTLGSMPVGDMQHLIVRVCSLDNGQVVTDARPSITLADLTTGSDPRTIPVLAMQSVDESPRDIHYGNDVQMPSGHSFEVIVRLDGETATFTIDRP